jgi:hypothetical protein
LANAARLNAVVANSVVVDEIHFVQDDRANDREDQGYRYWNGDVCSIAPSCWDPNDAFQPCRGTLSGTPRTLELRVYSSTLPASVARPWSSDGFGELLGFCQCILFQFWTPKTKSKSSTPSSFREIKKLKKMRSAPAKERRRSAENYEAQPDGKPVP